MAVLFLSRTQHGRSLTPSSYGRFYIAMYLPDGRFLFYSVYLGEDTSYMIVPAEGGEPIASFHWPVSAVDFEWLSDGNGVTYIRTVDGVRNLRMQPIDGNDQVQPRAPGPDGQRPAAVPRGE